jgi:capsular exopolysaccharide synthesis family protein
MQSIPANPANYVTSVDLDDSYSIDLHQYWQAIKRRWLPASLVIGSVVTLTVIGTSRQKPIYESEGTLRFNKNDQVSALTSLSESMGGQLAGLTGQSNPLDTEAEILKSAPVVQRVIAQLNLKDAKGHPLKIDDFRKQLTIKSKKGTDVMSVSFRSTDPDNAQAVVNRLIEAYLEANRRANRTTAVAAREFIDKQLPQVEARVRKAEQAMRIFKEENGVVALEQEGEAMVQGLQTLSEQLTETQAQLVDTSSQLSNVQQKVGLRSGQAIALSRLSQAETVKQVLAEYHKVQDELSIQRTLYQPEHPLIVNLTRKQAALQRQLNQRIANTLGSTQAVSDAALQMGEVEQGLVTNLVQLESQRQGLADRVKVLSNAMLNTQQRASRLPLLEQRQRELERRLQVARLTYEQLLKRLQEVEILENQTVANAQIVSPASLPEAPISPKVMMNLLLGGTAALVLGLLAVGLLESLDKSVRGVDEVKRWLNYPVLGKIPKLGNNLDRETFTLPLRDSLYSPASAAFEILQTRLGFTVTDRQLKVMVVTSSVPGEGKSTVSANLAIAMMQMGRRVLLIDADMRCPKQHKGWELPNLKGLSDVLVNQADYKTSIAKVLGNLYVLTAGTMPPNPTALLNSQRMQDLLATVSQEYDFVIVDTPPIGVIADALVVNRFADGLLLVARPGVVTSTALDNTNHVLQESQESILGVVVNGLGREAGSYGYGNYYHRYYHAAPKESQEPSEIASFLDKLPLSKK